MAAIRPSCSPGACLITGPLLEPLAEKTPPAPDHQPKHQSPCRHQPPGLPGSQVRLGPQPGQGPASCRGPQGGGGGSVASQARVSSQEEQPPAGPGTQLCASWLGSRPREPGLWKHLWAVAPSGLDVDMPSLLRAPKFRGEWGNLDCDGPAPPPGARQAKASLLPRSCVSRILSKESRCGDRRDYPGVEGSGEQCCPRQSSFLSPPYVEAGGVAAKGRVWGEDEQASSTPHPRVERGPSK